MAEDRTISTPVVVTLAVAALLVLVAIGALVRRVGSPPPTPRPVLSEDANAYLRNLAVTEARMSAAENFLGHTVTYLDLKVTNKGTKVVRQLEVQLEFVDTLNQVVLRETTQPVGARTPPLNPGETRPCRVPFEHMPAEWNQAPPAITPTYVLF